ncbi:MAG: tetratricopeptide repeat protein [Bacteroidia bacterium]|nr:tetratricopeptide repeat protein [Bacteroidia bacterium]
MLIPIWLFAQPNPTIQAFKAEKRFLEGRSLFDSRDFRGAIGVFQEVVSLNPDHEQVHEFLGEAYYELGSYQEAIDHYAIAAGQHPNNAEIRNSMGVAAAKLNLYDAAVAYFYDALQIDPGNQSARKNLEIARQRQQSPYASNYPSTQPVRPGSGTYDPYPYTPSYPPASSPGTQQPPSRPASQPAVQPAKDPNATYTFNDKQFRIGGRQSDPFVQIQQIKLTPAATQVTFTVEAVGSKDFKLALGRVGSSGALYLTDRFFKRTYKLRTIRNLPGWPEQPTTLRPGGRLMFVAEFDRLDEDVTFFHLLEGQTPKSGYWNFYDVELIY